MTATYIHTQKKPGFSGIVLRLLACLYFLGLAAAIVYLWCFTRNQYTSEASFKISMQSSAGGDSGLAQLVLPGLSNSGSMDSQVAIGYINSTDLLIELENEFNLSEHYTSPRQDFVFRMDKDDTLEERIAYYRKHISTHYDKDSGLTVIQVHTFDPALSQEIAKRVLDKAETFVNTINQQVANQQLGFIRSELKQSSDHVEELNKELITMQNEHKFIDPDQVISANLAAVQSMQLERMREEAELATLLRDSPGSPRVGTIRSHLRSINELIDIETAKLSGPEQDRLNQILVQFKQLQQKLEFATQMRTSAQTLLEKNRIEAIARSRFFSVVQKPFLPEYVSFPRLPYATLTILVLGILVFLILRAIVHSVVDRA